MTVGDSSILCSPPKAKEEAVTPCSAPLLVVLAEAPHCFWDWTVVFILTNDIIIEKSQTVNPVRCCHAFIVRKLEYGFKRPRAGGRVK